MCSLSAYEEKRKSQPNLRSVIQKMIHCYSPPFSLTTSDPLDSKPHNLIPPGPERKFKPELYLLNHLFQRLILDQSFHCEGTIMQ